MAWVIGAQGNMTQVKNLRWLVRHAGEVERISLLIEDGEAELVAHLRGGVRYWCHFASASIAAHWVHRPSLRGVPLTVEDTYGYVTEHVC